MSTFTYKNTSHAQGFINPVLSVQSNDPPSNIIFYAGANEVLKLSEDGFWVKGKKVDADHQEASAVYRAFKEFLVYHALTRPY